MPQGIKTSELRDLIESTKEARPFGGLVFTQNLASYPIMDRWFGGQDAVRQQVQGGTHIEETISLDDSHNAQFIRSLQRRTWQGVDVMQTMRLDWTTAETHWLIARDEMLMHLRNTAKGQNVGARAINLVESKRTAGMMSLANLLEPRAWAAPDAETDPLMPAGIPYWVPKRPANNPGKGFDGGSEQSPGDLVGGINPADYPRWRSYNAGGATAADGEIYLGTINDAAVKTMRELHKRLDFKAPTLVSQSVEEPYRTQSIYCGINVSLNIEEYLDTKNDGVRRETDLAWVEGASVFKRRPLIHTEILDDDSDNPIYFIDHGSFFVYMLAGNEFLEDDTIIPSDRPDAMITPVSVKFNFMCINRRRQGVMNAANDARSES